MGLGDISMDSESLWGPKDWCCCKKKQYFFNDKQVTNIYKF